MAVAPIKPSIILKNNFGEVSNNKVQGPNQQGIELSLETEGAIRTQAMKAIISLGEDFGSSDFEDPSSAFGYRGYVNGEDLSKTMSYNVGVAGVYNVLGSNASLMPKCGIMGIVGDTTITADAAVMAYMDGDGGVTVARCGFGIMMLNSTGGSHFLYGMDLKPQVISGHESFSRDYYNADVRLSNDIVVMSGATAPVSGATGTGDNYAGKGSIYIARDTGKMYLQGGLITSPDWKIVTSA